MRFGSFYNLNESLTSQNIYNVKGKKDVVFAIGRFNPPTIGHKKLIDEMSKSNKHSVLMLVRGKSTNEDVINNPLSLSEQKEMLKKSFPNVNEIIYVPTGFLGLAINELRKRDYEPSKLFIGSDRKAINEIQLKKYMTQWDTSMVINEVNRTEADVSSSKVRKSVIDNDLETFKKMTYNLDESDFELIRKKLSKN